jgi:hypothetical protein
LLPAFGQRMDNLFKWAKESPLGFLIYLGLWVWMLEELKSWVTPAAPRLPTDPMLWLTLLGVFAGASVVAALGTLVTGWVLRLAWRTLRRRREKETKWAGIYEDPKAMREVHWQQKQAMARSMIAGIEDGSLDIGAIEQLADLLSGPGRTIPPKREDVLIVLRRLLEDPGFLDPKFASIEAEWAHRKLSDYLVLGEKSGVTEKELPALKRIASARGVRRYILGRAASGLIRKWKSNRADRLARGVANQVFPVWAAQGPFKSGAQSAAAMRNAYLAVLGPGEAEAMAEAIAGHALVYDRDPAEWEKTRQDAARAAGPETAKFVERIMVARQDEAPGSGLALTPGDRGEREALDPLPSEEAIGQMSLGELHALVDPEHRVLPDQVTVGFLSAIYRRAMEIACHSHGTANDDRTQAAIIAKVIREQLLKGGECPAELRAAIDATERNARQFGYGTLPWLLEEHKLPANQSIQFTMRSENAHLVGGLLDTLKPDVRAGLRPALIAELLRSRRVANSDSLVFVAHGLAVAHEPATLALFNQAELAALRNAHRDYETARAVLSVMGLLPPATAARAFEPPPPQSLIAECISMSLLRLWANESEREPALFFSGLDPRWRDSFDCARLGLCGHLALATINAIYGSKAYEALRERDLPRIVEVLGRQSADFVKALILIVNDMPEEVAERSCQTFDGMILGLVALAYIPNSDLQSEPFGDVHGLLTNVRVNFLSELRFNLRAMCKGYQLSGFNSSLDASVIFTTGLENSQPSSREDIVFCAPFGPR